MNLENERPFVVAIDGVAGSGKSSLAKALSIKFSWAYINTGAFYRGFAYICSLKKLSCSDLRALEDLLPIFSLNFCWDVQQICARYKQKELTETLLQQEFISQYASKISALPFVRESLVSMQKQTIKQLGNTRGIVIEGRDIGTVVYPNADIKLFITASLKIRTKRRCRQLNLDANAMESIFCSIDERDKRDKNRQISPITKTNSTLEFDTSDLSFKESFSKLSTLIVRYQDRV